MKKRLLAVSVLLFFTISTHGQDTATDSLAKANMQTAYNQSVQQQRLYNGVRHTGYSPSMNGLAYFPSRNWQMGSLLYHGIYYKDVPMMYDAHKDQVIVKHPNEAFIVALVPSKVRSFEVPGHRFIRIEQDELPPNMQAGFYEVLAEGTVTVLARRTRPLRDFINTTTNQVQYEFTEQDMYFIKKENVYHAVRRESTLLDILGDQRNQVKQFLRKNNIRFKRGAEQAIVKAVEYYETLKN